ncbi:hypothetical protein M5K25_006827 [Dendrobium thyrsiflorum]|uniref:F-box protein n=1 Tax=Dendrobium thyrsiflorum TaxID=117978 RepID=A0ABD0VJL8_DENTH
MTISALPLGSEMRHCNVVHRSWEEVISFDEEVWKRDCLEKKMGWCDKELWRVDDGQEIDGLPTEGLEITCFNLDGTHYMIYTPSEPLLFVAIKIFSLEKSIEFLVAQVFDLRSLSIFSFSVHLYLQDENGILQIAEDDILEDPAIIGAIDEETEFNALVGFTSIPYSSPTFPVDMISFIIPSPLTPSTKGGDIAALNSLYMLENEISKEYSGVGWASAVTLDLAWGVATLFGGAAMSCSLFG